MGEVAAGHEPGAIGLHYASASFHCNETRESAHTKLFLTASLTFSTLISEKPRILRRCLLC